MEQRDQRIMDEITYTIAEASERLGLTYRSLHYYEDKLNLRINRDPSGNRFYSENDIAILERVVDLKQKGMTLDGIKKILEESGVVSKADNSALIIMDENTLLFKDYILNEIRDTIATELQATNEKLDDTMSKLDQVLQDNQDLKEEIRIMNKQTGDHYSKIDQQLTAWRNKQPWYKSLFTKKSDKKDDKSE